jgi:integrase
MAETRMLTEFQDFNDLIFLFRDVLREEFDDLKGTMRAKRGKRLPAVLSVDEVKALFLHLKGKSLLMAQLLYEAGLRLMELARLRVQDIDFNANLPIVRSGKGGQVMIGSNILTKSLLLDFFTFSMDFYSEIVE